VTWPMAPFGSFSRNGALRPRCHRASGEREEPEATTDRAVWRLSTRGRRLLAGIITRTEIQGADAALQSLAMRNKKTARAKNRTTGPP